MNYMNKLMRIGGLALLLAVAFASCVPQKKMLLLKASVKVGQVVRARKRKEVSSFN